MPGQTTEPGPVNWAAWTESSKAVTLDQFHMITSTKVLLPSSLTLNPGQGAQFTVAGHSAISEGVAKSGEDRALLVKADFSKLPYSALSSISHFNSEKDKLKSL